jgi:predicted dehydrogenase
MRKKMDRRDFIKSSVAGTVAAGVALGGNKAGEALGQSRANVAAGGDNAGKGLGRSNRREEPGGGGTNSVRPGATDRIVVGVIGTGRRGLGNLNGFMKQADVEIAGICDVYAPNLDNAADKAAKATRYTDFRKLLDRKDVDAVIVATPDHWHAPAMIMACEAGKDVYVEKPLSLTVYEGRKMVDAARRSGRVVQVGTQQRSGIHFQRAVEIVRGGMLGKISFVRTWNYGNQYPAGIGNPPDSDPPQSLDWETWLGPAPRVRFNANRFGVSPDRWSTFRCFWDYAGGMMTDWGVHLIDIVQWAMGVDYPKRVSATGGKLYLRDNRETPDTLMVTYEYPGFVCNYENRECNGSSINGQGYGIMFHGTEGTLYVNREFFEIIPEKKPGPDKKPVDRMDAVKEESSKNENVAHIRNFLDCVKSRQRPISDIEIGHRSTSTCLLGNVAYRSGEAITWDGKTERITNSRDASRYLSNQPRKGWWLV